MILASGQEDSCDFTSYPTVPAEGVLQYVRAADALNLKVGESILSYFAVEDMYTRTR